MIEQLHPLPFFTDCALQPAFDFRFILPDPFSEASGNSVLTGCQWSPRKITTPVLLWQEALKGWFLSPPLLPCIRTISPTVRECIQRHDLGLEIMRCLSCTLLFNHLPKKGTIYCFWYFSSRQTSDFKSSRSSPKLCTEENKVASEHRIFGSNFSMKGLTYWGYIISGDQKIRLNYKAICFTMQVIASE